MILYAVPLNSKNLILDIYTTDISSLWGFFKTLKSQRGEISVENISTK